MQFDKTILKTRTGLIRHYVYINHVLIKRLVHLSDCVFDKAETEDIKQALEQNAVKLNDALHKLEVEISFRI